MGQHDVSYLVAGRTFLEKAVAARRAGIDLFLIAAIVGHNDLVDGAARPEKKTARPGADGVFTHRAQKPLVGFPVLLDQPLGFWKGDSADEMNQQSRHYDQQTTDEDVFEVPGREVLVNHQGDLEQGGRAKGQVHRKVDALTFPDDKNRCRRQNRQQYCQLKQCQFQSMFATKSVELRSCRLALFFNLLFCLIPFPNKLLLAFQHVRNGLTQLLVFRLVVQKEIQAAGEVRLFRVGEGDVFLHAKFLQLDELVDGLLEVAGAVPDNTLLLLLVVDLARQIGDLIIQVAAFFDEILVQVFLFDRAVVGAWDGADVIDKKTKSPKDKDGKDHGEELDGKTMNPCAF